MNNKEVKLAMRSALSAKLRDNELVLVDDYGFGDLFEAVEDERLARELAEQRIAAAKEKQFSSFQTVSYTHLLRRYRLHRQALPP